MSKPIAIKDVLPSVIGVLGVGKKDEITEGLNKVLDKKALSRVKPQRYEDGKLIINVDSSAWLYRLKLEEKTILNKLNALFPGLGVKEILFKLGKVY